MSHKSLLLLLIGFCLLHTTYVFSEPTQVDVSQKNIKRFNLGGEGGWDLLTLDTKNHHLFISRGTHVQVMDVTTGKLAGDIPNTEGVHGIAIAPELNLGFTSNGKSNSITVFNLTTLDTLDKINISGQNPDVIIYEPKSKHVFSFNGRSNNTTVIDAISLKEITSIPLSGKPELAVMNQAGNIFVNIEDKSEITVIDSTSNQVIKHYPLGAGKEPTGLAFDEPHHRLFAVCANKKMIILDSETGHIVSEVGIGADPDSAAFDTNRGIALSPNGEGTLSIVKESDAEHFALVKTIITQKGARTMAYDPSTQTAYLVTANFGETPQATKEIPNPKPRIIPGTFVVLAVKIND
jgi:YVTN family beta-propeller protein